jgi:flagellar biosynthesis component FlhA
MITRASKDESNFAEGVIGQLANDYKVLMIVGFGDYNSALLLLFWKVLVLVLAVKNCKNS